MASKTHEQLLRELGLGGAEAAVYAAMIHGAERVRDIMKVTSLKRPTVYYALSELVQRGLVHRTGAGEGATYGLASLDRLTHIANERKTHAIEVADEAQSFVTAVESKLGTRERPHVSFVEGKNAIRHAIMESLYGRSRAIDTIAPHDNFFWQIGPDFVREYVEERNRRHIRTKSLWEKPLASKVFRTYYSEHNQVRILPSSVSAFATTVFLYDDRVMYLSSLKNAYCLTVISKEHFTFMQAMFNGLWQSAKPHPR